MQHISEIIEDILIEWSYRVHDGMPNPKNVQHIQELRKSMEKLNLPNKVIYEVIQNLINEDEGGKLSDKEKEKAKKMGLISLGYGNYGKEKGGKTTHKNVDGKLLPVSDDGEPEKETKPPMKIDTNPFDQKSDEKEQSTDTKKVSFDNFKKYLSNEQKKAIELSNKARVKKLEQLDSLAESFKTPVAFLEPSLVSFSMTVSS